MKKNKLSYIAIRYFLSTLLLIMFMAALPVYAADLGNIKALTKAKQAIKENPNSVRDHIKYQVAMINDGWRDAMITEYSERLKDNKSPENIFLLCRLTEDVEATATVYEELIDSFPGFSWGYYGLAYVLQQRGDSEGAMQLYKFVLDIDPDHVEAYEQMASLYNELEDYVKAHDSILMGLKHIPDNPQLQALHAGYLRFSDHYEEALVIANEVLSAEPDHEVALRELCYIYSGMKKYEEAVVAGRYYLSLWPSKSWNWSYFCADLFALYDENKDVKILNEAEHACFEAVNRSNEDLDILTYFVAFFNKRDWTVHWLWFNQHAFKLVPTDHVNYAPLEHNMDWIQENEIAGQSFPNELAVPKDYLHSLKDLSESERATFGVDETSVKWQQFESTMGTQSEVSSESLNSVVEAHPDFAPAYYNRGVAHLNNRTIGESLADLKHSTILEPEWGRAHAALAVGYIMNRDYSNARKSLQSADTIGIDNPAFEYNKSFMRLFDEAVVMGTVKPLQDMAEAVRRGGGPDLDTFGFVTAFTRYFKRDPTSPEIYEAYGDIFFAHSNDFYWTTALENYKKALELGGDKKRLTDKIAKISAIKDAEK